MYLWEEDMSVGNEKLDYHHKVFLDQISQYAFAARQGRSPEKAGQLLLFLMDYAREHFLEEEKYMSEHKYPDVEKHASAHALFVTKLIEFQNKLKAEGSTPDLAIEIQQFTGDWLIHHIRTADKAYATFIAKRVPPAEIKEVKSL